MHGKVCIDAYWTSQRYFCYIKCVDKLIVQSDSCINFRNKKGIEKFASTPKVEMWNVYKGRGKQEKLHMDMNN